MGKSYTQVINKQKDGSRIYVNIIHTMMKLAINYGFVSLKLLEPFVESGEGDKPIGHQTPISKPFSLLRAFIVN